MSAEAIVPAPGGGARSLPPRIRVVHVLDNLNTGGTELNAVRTAERLDRARFDVQFLCLQAHGPLRARLDAAGIPVREIAVPGLLSAGAIRRGLEIRRLVRQERTDVIHAHDPYANVLAAPWVRLAGRGAMIASHRWWKAVHQPRLRAANRLAYRFAHRVLANSASVGELVVREEGVPRDRLVVIPNFVDASAFEPMAPERRRALRARFHLGADDLVVGIVANLYPVKDHATLVRAAARLAGRWPAVRWVLAGEGAERDALTAQVAAAGMAGRITLPGRIAPESGLAGIFDVAVLTSVEEGFPNWIVEAMAAGLPVVATTVGGVPDAVVHDTTGLMVPAGDDVAAAAALDQLLGDRAMRDRMGAAGRVRARSLYHVDTVLPALESLYVELAGPSTVRRA